MNVAVTFKTPIPVALYGGRHAVTMLPGGGIGPELMTYIREVFKYAGAPVDFEVIDIDPKTDEGNQLEYAITSIKRNGVAIKGCSKYPSISTVQLSIFQATSRPRVKARS